MEPQLRRGIAESTEGRDRGKLATAGVECLNIDSSLYFRDPDGTRVELINDPLGEMYGNAVL